MNVRNKKLVITMQVILGLFMIFSGVSGLLMDLNDPQLAEMISPEMIANTKALMDMGLMHMIKITEIIGGAMLLFNIFPALAVIVLASVAVGAVVVNAVTAPIYLPMACIFGLFIMYFGYAYWGKYKVLFTKGI